MGTHTFTLAATSSGGTTVEAAVPISITTLIVPRFHSGPAISGDNLELEVVGEMGTQVTFETSVDLKTGTILQSTTFATDVAAFKIPLNFNEPQRFFRAHASP